MIISVASGKGGTGKTTIATSLALVAGDVQFIDCDVEEPNASIFLHPQISGEEPATIAMPVIDESLCTWCGECQRICQFNALAVIPPLDKGKGKVLRFDTLCHGCGACTRLCPEQAIIEEHIPVGTIQWGTAPGNGNGLFEIVQGSLDIGQALATPVVKAAKQHINRDKTVIIDAPPGTSCPVIESLYGSDFCLLVTEPTPFGLNDLQLAVELMQKLQIPFGVVINRWKETQPIIDTYCEEHDIQVVFRIPFSKQIAEAYSRGIPLIQAFSEAGQLLRGGLEIINELANIAWRTGT